MIDGHCVRNLARSLVRLCLIEVPLVLMISASSRAQTFAVLHTFTGDDGSSPYAGVTVDRAGNLYGTTKYGGTASCDLGCGVLFKVAPQGSGWNFAALYKFAGPSDGKSPIARIVFGPDGRLYGTTLIGGNTTVNGGTVFTLTPPPTVCRASCYWVKTTLWSFEENDGDAHNPGYGDLVFDAAGNIYGTTEEGGTTQPACGPGCGTVFMLSRSQGSWRETLIYQFGDGPGYHPYAGVASPYSALTIRRTASLYSCAQHAEAHLAQHKVIGLEDLADAVNSGKELVGERGFEPPPPGPEPDSARYGKLLKSVVLNQLILNLLHAPG